MQYIGRDRDGLKVYVEINLTKQRLGMTGTDHQPVSGPTERLSITGEIRKGRRVESCGQITLGPIDTTDSAWNAQDVATLRQIWADWHLNDMNAACDHMTVRKGGDYDANKHQVCAESGYKYGSAWLYRPIPSHILKEVKRLSSIR